MKLSDEQRFVLAALLVNPWSYLREIHQIATQFEESPFEYSPEIGEGWNQERRTVQARLYELNELGLVQVGGRGKPWQPTLKGQSDNS